MRNMKEYGGGLERRDIMHQGAVAGGGDQRLGWAMAHAVPPLLRPKLLEGIHRHGS